MKDGTYIVRVDEDGIPRLSEPIAMSRGYWVSTEGVSVHGKLDKDGIIDALELMDIHDGAIVGLWENEGLTYVDKSIHIRSKLQALATAEVFGQLAIYDCKNDRAINI
jgi:hypothetical protein